MGVLDHLTHLLRNLYGGQEATVRTGHGTTDWFKIGLACIFVPKRTNGHFTYLLSLAQTLKSSHQYLLGMRLCPHLVPKLLWLPPGRWAPKSPSYIAKRIYIHESHKIIANKGAAFKQEWKQLPQILTYVKYRENRQNIHIPASPCEGFKLHAFPAASKGLASNQPASRC